MGIVPIPKIHAAAWIFGHRWGCGDQRPLTSPCCRRGYHTRRSVTHCGISGTGSLQQPDLHRLPFDFPLLQLLPGLTGHCPAHGDVRVGRVDVDFSDIRPLQPQFAG